MMVSSRVEDMYKGILLVISLLAAGHMADAFKISSLKRSVMPLMKGAKGEGGEKLFFKDRIPTGVTVARLGQSLTMDCEAGGSPAPTIHWLKKGNRIVQGGSNEITDDEAIFENTDVNSNVPMLRLGATKSKLFIDCVSEADIGEYTCVADTPNNRISTSTVVEIDESGAGDYVDACVMKRIESGTPARIYMWTIQRLEFEGADVQLFCRASGSPAPTATWFDRDGNAISYEAPQYKLLHNGDLLIKGVTWMANMGLYRCVVENDSGSDQISTFLYPTSP